jgi:MoxR-like ATPase
MEGLDEARVGQAADRFESFFAELEETFVERKQVLQQIALALLAREHVLVTGPPGTAKSQLAHAAFGRIVCESTGAPSMFARQITESTVQTDLIGPIDFKNLMATGRTTSFTDEGLLGSVHAFLDEVFDGRDMLLRSALNLLQERHVKQGGHIERGRVECALMTTNRYIADVVAHSRDTLLAFVDRIAFISFVPRGFADPSNLAAVLHRHVGRGATVELDARLTLQDVDALQALGDQVVVSPQACQALAVLLERYDDELNAAVRADAEFVPTRYLSTRTAVRCGKILRAICAYRYVFGERSRALEVQRGDFDSLRLHLVLSGPEPDALAKLIENESDPSERRQLSIARTEREIFDRCLEKVPSFVPSGRGIAPPRPGATSTPPSATASPAAGATAEPSSEDRALAECARKLGRGSVDAAMEVLRTALPLASGTDANARRARELCQQATAQISKSSLRGALEAHATANDGLLERARKLKTLALTLDDSKASTHDLAAGLRKKAQEMIDDLVRFGAFEGETLLEERPASHQTIERRVTSLAELAAMRAELETHPGTEWINTVNAFERELAVLAESSFCKAVAQSLGGSSELPLAQMLERVSSELDWLSTIEQRVSAIGGWPSRLRTMAIGDRLGELIEVVFTRIDVTRRDALHGEIARVKETLEKADIGSAITTKQWFQWAATALVRGEPEAPTDLEPACYLSYTKLRQAEQRTPIGYTLCEVALQVADGELAGATNPAQIAPLFTGLDPSLRQAIGELDLSRVERAVGLLEAWWTRSRVDGAAAEDPLRELTKSELFRVLWDQGALARFALEVRLVAELFPEHAARAEALRARMVRLYDETKHAAFGLLRDRTAAAWRRALALPES